MSPKILIVDDDPNNLDILHHCLYKAGFKVLTVENGEAALKRVNYIKPDLILLDVMMPGIDGFETFRCLKKHQVTKETPIIFITAKTDPVDKVKGLKMGAVDYINKPFQPIEVIARINKHLTIRDLQKQLEAKNAQLQDSVYHLESLVTLGKAINQAQNVAEMMEKTMQVTLTVFNCDRALLLYPADPNAPSCRVQIEVNKPEVLSTQNTEIAMEPEISAVIKETLSAKEPIAFGPHYEHKVPSSIAEGFSVQSELCLAIQPEMGKPWLFGLQQCSDDRIWTENELNLFSEFGEHIAISLGASISFEALHKTEKRLSRKRYPSVIAASKPIQKIYHSIFRFV